MEEKRENVEKQEDKEKSWELYHECKTYLEENENIGKKENEKETWKTRKKKD